MAGFKDFFIPRETLFFDHLETQADLLNQATIKLSFLPKTYTKIQLKRVGNSLDKLTVEGDALMNLITLELHKTFLTPIDREEIQILSFNLNRILHSVLHIANAFETYHIFKLNPALVQLITLLKQSVNNLVDIFDHPLSITKNQTLIAKINEIEKKADAVFREALEDLFIKSRNPIDIIKQKELLQIVEETIDKTEFIANVMQNILINEA